VLELGCGGGGPTTQRLAARFRLTGIDISARQIEKARQNVPQATFLRGDMAQIDFPPASFDGIASFYAFLHLPAGALPGLLMKCARWLRPGGLLVATMAGGAGAGMVEPNFLGAPMYFSGYAPEENWRFVREAGLEIVSTSRERNVEDGRQVGFLWLVARKPERVGAGRMGQVPP
jgi:SAM-dependent methyltransferase